MATTAELQILLKAKDDATAELKKISKELGTMSGATKAPQAGFTSLFATIGKAASVVGGLLLVGKAASGIGDAIGSAVGSAIGFEKSMSAIRAVSGATGQEMAQLSKLALDLGRDTSFSASEAASGIEELVKGGVSIADIYGGAASSALSLAAAGGVSLGEAATIAANAMNQFGLRGSDMENVANKVAGAANASSISVSDFNLSLSAVGAVAHLAGQSFDSTATAIALLGQQGIKGSDAGTSLKAVLNNLIPTTDTATTKMRELGIITSTGANQFVDAQGKMKGFGDIAEILQTQTAGLTESQRLLALELIFGSDGMRAAGILATQGSKGFNDLAGSMDKVTAASVAAERLNNLSGDIEQLKGSVETAGITVASVFLPALRGIAQASTSAVNSFTQEFNTIKVTAENISGAYGIGLIPAALTAVELRIGEVFGPGTQTLFHNTRAAVEEMAKGWNGLAASTDHNSEIIRDAMTRMDTSALAQSTEHNAAIFRKAWEDMAASTTHNSQVIQQSTAETQAAAASANEKTVAFLNENGAHLEKSAADFGAWNARVTEAMNVAGADLGHFSETVIGALNAAAPAADNFSTTLAASLNAGAVNAGNASARIAEALNVIGPAAGQAVADAVSALGGLIVGLGNVGVQALNQATAIGANIASGMAAGIAGGVSRVIGAAVNLASSAISAARAALDSHSPSKVFEDIGLDVDQGFIDGVEGGADDLIGAVEDMLSQVRETAEAGAVDAFANLGTILGAQFEKTFTIVQRAEEDINNARADIDRKFQRDSALEETKYQRRLQDLREEAGRVSVKQRADVLQKIAQLQEDHGRKVVDMQEATLDRISELEFDAADKIAQAQEKQNLVRGAALRDFQRGTDDLLRDTADKAAAIGKKASDAISAAMADAGKSIQEAKDRADEAIQSLQDNQAASRELRGVRDTFSAGQDAESKARDRKQEDADLEYNLKRDLEKAKLKLGKDRGKAETDQDRRQLDIQYADEVQNLKDGFEEAKRDLARRRAIADDNDAFRKNQQKALQAFNDALEDDALRKQIKRLQEERDTRVKELGKALDDKLKQINQSEKDEREALAKSAAEKLDDLKTKFYDKVGQLNDESKGAFESLFDSIAKGVAAAAGAVDDLATAINKVATMKAPNNPTSAGGGGKAAADGQTFGGQTPAVQEMFLAAFGSRAAAEEAWIAQHEYELDLGNLGKPPKVVNGVDMGPYNGEAGQSWFSTPEESGSNAGDHFAGGGVVPGARGAARLVTAHGQETIRTPEQEAALRSGGGGNITIVAEIDGQRFASGTAPYLQGELDRMVRLKLG